MPAKILLTLMLTVFPFTILFADIIITIDDMILNGKILKEDKKTVKFFGEDLVADGSLTKQE